MTHSQLLRGKMELTCSELLDTLDAFWRSPDLPAAMPGFLILLHQIMRASVPLMETARRRAVALDAGERRDPVSRGLVSYFDLHIPEERDHDRWILEDLAALGLKSRSVLREIPPPSVASLVGAQYYWIEHHHPVALLGYIAVLEGFPPRRTRIDAVQRKTGLPRAAFRTYRKHAELDPFHRLGLDRALDALPLDRDQQGLVGMSAAHTAALLSDCIGDLCAVDAHARAGAV
jgi:hypothetical protein